MGTFESYTPKAIKHLKIVPGKERREYAQRKECLIMFRPNRTLSVPELALIGMRMIDLRPSSVLSTLSTNKGYISVTAYIAYDITHMDITIYAHNYSQPKGSRNPIKLVTEKSVNYHDLIGLLDGAMLAVLQNSEDIWQ